MVADGSHAVWADGNQPVLVVCFSGNHESLAWEKRLRRLDVHFLHLQDSKGRWYLEGADGSAGFWNMVDKIRRFQATLPGLPLVTMGQSSGGYAALRVGSILNAARILAFAPQTHFLEPRRLYKDQHSLGTPRDLVDIRHRVNSARGHITLVVARSEAMNPPSQYFFDDHAHLQGLEPRPNVKTIIHDSESHAVARILAEAGLLDDLILQEVSGALSQRHFWSKLAAVSSNWLQPLVPGLQPSRRKW